MVVSTDNGLRRFKKRNNARERPKGFLGQPLRERHRRGMGRLRMMNSRVETLWVANYQSHGVKWLSQWNQLPQLRSRLLSKRGARDVPGDNGVSVRWL